MLSPSTSALGRAADEATAEDEGLRQAVRAGLHAVADVHAPLAAVAEQGLEARRVLRRADQQDVADAGQHQRGQRVVDHRLVVHRQQLLAQRQRGRVQPGARAAGQDDASAWGVRGAHACAVLVQPQHFAQHALDADAPVGQRQAEGCAAACACPAASCAGACAGRRDRRWSARLRCPAADPQRPARRRARIRSRGARSRASWFRRAATAW